MPKRARKPSVTKRARVMPPQQPPQHDTNYFEKMPDELVLKVRLVATCLNTWELPVGRAHENDTTGLLDLEP